MLFLNKFNNLTVTCKCQKSAAKVMKRSEYLYYSQSDKRFNSIFKNYNIYDIDIKYKCNNIFLI